MNNNDKKSEFSKFLLKQESALIWLLSISFIILAFYCIHEGFTGSLPWLAAMVGFPWTAYGVSQAMYYKKSMAENTIGGIKYDMTMEEIRKAVERYEEVNHVDLDFDFSMFENGTDPYAEESEAYEIIDNVDDYQI